MPRTMLITGATEGIGQATALALAAKGHRLIVHGRNPDKAARVLDEARRRGAHAESTVVLADFDSLEAVSALAEQVGPLAPDVVINNAAAMFSTRRTTRDGFEANWGVNVLAPSLLTLKLLAGLKTRPGARIVNLSSVGYQQARPDFDDLQSERAYSMQAAYFTSKLFNLYFTLELAQRLGPAVTVNAVHPGGVQTQLARDFRGPMKWLFALMMPVFFSSPEKGAETSVFLADDASVASTTGQYFVKRTAEALKPIGTNADHRARFWTALVEALRPWSPPLPS
jgi:NAD(P)-dependent dehydrogenase (short-subunit alcohol dehydrogenase family)